MALKETIPFNFDDIYANIEQKFKDKKYDIEEGSNTMQLVTAMSYMVSMLNANTAVNINETVLSLARKRNNVLQDARILGYEIDHKKSYVYKIEIEYTGTDDFTLEKYTGFSVNDKIYYYLGQTLYTNDLTNNKVTIEVKEGILKTYTDNETLSTVIGTYVDDEGQTKTQYYVDVPFVDVENDGLEVYLSYYKDNGEYVFKELWTKSEQFMIDADTLLDKKFVRIDEIDYRTPRVYFKIGDTGADLRVGTSVEINALISSGLDGKIIDITDANVLKHNIPDVTINSIELVSEGSNEESIQSIKQNAPLFHNSANRAVTKPDYIAFCNRQGSVKQSYVWDGEDEYPKRPGYIWFSFIPSAFSRSFSYDSYSKTYLLDDNNDKTNMFLEPDELTNAQDNGVFDFLANYKIPTLQLLHRNPVYVDFEYDISIVRYNISSSKTEINKKVYDVINDYFVGVNEDEPAETYDFEYFQSNLIKRIDNTLTDITGFNITLNTTAQLFSNHIINEFDDKKEVRINLALPYEDIYDENGTIILENLPNINTTSFINGEDLTFDYNVVGNEESNLITDIPMHLSGSVDQIGVYRIHNSHKKYVEVIFYIESTGHVNGIPEANFDNLILDVKYPSPNIKFIRNTIPRLKKVTFK